MHILGEIRTIRGTSGVVRQVVRTRQPGTDNPRCLPDRRGCGLRTPQGSNGNEVSEAKLAFVVWRRAFCFSGHGETALARVLVNGQHLRASPLERW